MELTFYLRKVIETLLIGTAVSALMGPVSIKLAYKFDIIDRPRDDRRVHDRPIPRFGGLAIFVGSMVAMITPATMNDNIRIAMMGGMLENDTILRSAFVRAMQRRLPEIKCISPKKDACAGAVMMAEEMLKETES